MKIAVHVDAVGQPASLYKKGAIHLYEENSDHWKMIDEFAFVIPAGASIAQVRGLAAKMVARLRDCHTLISGDRNGCIYALLSQEMGLSCWTSEGSVAEQLSMVARKSQEIATAGSACARTSCGTGSCGGGRGISPCSPDAAPPPPEDLGGGKLRVDVAGIMRAVPSLNSRQILLPVIEGGKFSALEVVCDHLPRWFEGKIEELGLIASFEERPGIGITATLTRPAS